MFIVSPFDSLAIRVDWTIFAEEADPPRRFGRRQLGNLPGSTHTSTKKVPQTGEAASKLSG
jgi:hypothetical protein